MSDASLNQYRASTFADVGRVARPVDSSGGPAAGSLAVNGRFPVRGYRLYPTFGERVHKVGVITGWTYGNVLRTCATVVVVDFPKYDLLCHYFAGYSSGGGDSGAPVFARSSTQGDSITVLGIHSARRGDSALFSPWSGVREDLGSLIVW